MRPMSPLTKRLVATSVLLLSMGIAAVLVLRSLGVPIGAGAAASPSATASPRPSQAASALPEPTASPDLLDAITQIEAQIRQLRGLAEADVGPPDILTRAELTTVLEELFAEAYPPDVVEAANAALRALGLLAADQDIAELTEQLYVAQVLGFYDFEDRRMVVVSDAGFDALARITYAHEYTHALQDAAFGIGAIRDELQEADDDVAMAQVALEEGDASLAMILWAVQAGGMSDEELLGISQTPLPDMTGIPGWMVRQAEFPYVAGAEFVGQLYFSGGWDAVDAAYADPPASTEQVLHPEKYLADEEPRVVQLPDLAAALSADQGGDWREAEQTTLGEAMIAIWLDEIGLDVADGDAAAAGWAGDRLSVASGPDGAWAMAFSIAWDTGAQATEFADAYQTVVDALPFDASLVRVSNSETLVVHASAPNVLASAIVAASP